MRKTAKAGVTVRSSTKRGKAAKSPRLTPPVNSKTAALTARVVGEITGRARSTVLLWMHDRKLPSSFRMIEQRRVRVTTKRQLQAFMRKAGIESKVGWFKVVAGKRSGKNPARRKAG